MKVAILTCAFPPYKGGIGNIAYLNALALYKLGHDVTVFTPLYSRIKAEESYPFKVERLLPLIKFGNAALCPQLLFKLSKFKRIFVLYPFFGGAEFAAFLKIIKKKKVILFISYHMDVVLSGGAGKIAAFHKKHILPKIIKAADKVSFTSFDYGRDSDIKNFISDKFIELPNGIDLQKFHKLSAEKINEFKKIKKISSSENILLFCGGLDQAHYFKGVDILLYALKKATRASSIRKTKLIIIGEGALRKNYEELSEKLGMKDKVVFAGKTSDEDLISYYNCADVLLLPSINKGEAFGLVLIEALACGTPVIASDLPGVRSVFIEGEHGLLAQPGDSDDLAEKIKIILNNDELRLKMSQQAREHAKKYDWKKSGDIIAENFNLKQ